MKKFKVVVVKPKKAPKLALKVDKKPTFAKVAKAGRPWTDKEVAILRSEYATSPTVKLASRLRRSVPAIRAKAHMLGLRKKRVRSGVKAACIKRSTPKKSTSQLRAVKTSKKPSGGTDDTGPRGRLRRKPANNKKHE